MALLLLLLLVDSTRRIGSKSHLSDESVVVHTQRTTCEDKVV